MTPQDLPLVTKSQLVQDLGGLGLQAGDVVMLHASVKAVGWIVGGPDVVLDAILEVLTPAGTLLMLASWLDNPYDLARWPEARRQAYLAECPPYDPATSRADYKEMGILAEYLRTRPGAFRSGHPFSYAAVGAQARYLTENHPLQYGNGPGSPLAKLCELQGRVLLLGRLFENVTVLHHAEHLAGVPGKRIDRYRMPLLLDGQRVWVDFEEYNTSTGIVDWEGDYFEQIVQDYLARGHGQTGLVGAAPAYLFAAPDLVQFGIEWMERNFVNQDQDAS